MAKKKSQRRGSARRKRVPPVAIDSHEVLKMFAVACRTVCADPAALASVRVALAQWGAELGAPEKYVVEAGAGWWRDFEQAAQQCPPAEWRRQGPVWIQRLEAIGQQWDLMPLPDWEELPETFNLTAASPKPRSPRSRTGRGKRPGLEQVARLARRRLRTARSKRRALSPVVMELLALLSADDRQRAVALALGSGVITRAEGQLVLRRLESNPKIARGEKVLVEAVEKLGVWLEQY